MGVGGNERFRFGVSRRDDPAPATRWLWCAMPISLQSIPCSLLSSAGSDGENLLLGLETLEAGSLADAALMTLSAAISSPIIKWSCDGSSWIWKTKFLADLRSRSSALLFSPSSGFSCCSFCSSAFPLSGISLIPKDCRRQLPAGTILVALLIFLMSMSS